MQDRDEMENKLKLANDCVSQLEMVHTSFPQLILFALTCTSWRFLLLFHSSIQSLVKKDDEHEREKSVLTSELEKAQKDMEIALEEFEEVLHRT